MKTPETTTKSSPKISILGQKTDTLFNLSQQFVFDQCPRPKQAFFMPPFNNRF